MKHPDRRNKKKHVVNKIVRSKTDDVNLRVYDSLKWKTENIKGIIDIIKYELNKSGLKVDENLILEQVKKNIKAISPSDKKLLNELASVRKAKEILEKNIMNEEIKTNELLEKKGIMIEKTSRINNLDDYTLNELSLLIKKAYATADAVDKSNQEPGLTMDQTYIKYFKDIMTDEEYKNVKKKVNETNSEFNDELKRISQNVNIENIEDELIKNRLNLIQSKEARGKIANELREKVNSLLETCNMAMSKPDLSVDDMYELVFKDIFTKDEYQKIRKEAYEEMVKLGHYRNDDSNKNH